MVGKKSGALQNSVTTKIQYISQVITSWNIIIHPIQSIYKTPFSIFIRSNASKKLQISAQKFFSILKYIRAKCLHNEQRAYPSCRVGPGAPVLYCTCLHPRCHNQDGLTTSPNGRGCTLFTTSLPLSCRGHPKSLQWLQRICLHPTGKRNIVLLKIPIILQSARVLWLTQLASPAVVQA